MLERLKLAILLSSTVIVGYGLIGGILERVSAGDESYRDLSVFTSVFSKVQNDYVEEPDMTKAMGGALHGMMEALDPFSSFIDPETFDLLTNRETSAGIGVELSKRYGYGYVVSVIEESPAHDNGLRVGDLIESIDGRPTALMSLWEAEQRLLGSEGSQVSLRLIRSRRSEPQELVLDRAIMGSEAVVARVVDSELGVLKIPGFAAGEAELVESKLRMLLSSKISGLLIDLRGASSGEVEEAVEAADAFLPVGALILKVTGRKGNSVDYVSLKEPLVVDLPVVLLVDGGTSSAAEVLVSALKDNGIGWVVGERTNGHGSSQERFDLEDGGVLFISTELFHRPNGELLQSKEPRKSGIQPDVLSPSRDFVTNFYFDNTPDDDVELKDDFYRRLDEAVESEQLKNALDELKKNVRGGEESEERIAA